MHDHIFLSSFDKGITRAHCATDGQWQVEQLATEHKVNCVAAAPSDNNVVYAGATDGVLRSDDRGITWLRSGMDGHIVKSLAVSPQDPDVVYAGTKPALMFISRDGGQTWRELDGFRRIPNRWWWFSPAEPGDFRAYVMAIALSPEDPDVVMAGVEFGAVVRSEDGGETWSRHRSGALRDCHSLKFHARDGNWAYEAGGTGGGASFSRDGGQTFQKSKRGLAKNYGIVCAADPQKPEIWYVCVARSPQNAYGKKPEIYLYRATGGAGWQPIGWQPHPLPVAPTALITVPGAPGHLYAGLYNGDIWHSIDYGDSWEQLPFNMSGIWFSLLVI
ncbi:MAG TPA: hypothetical protein VK879_15245 [Candidatus Sulfomarinibacteraceae bacterium]|nr:hypothetical protein [Candidatus Sulfomarinibacteraceae bacterium]